MKRVLNELEFLTWSMGEPANAGLACRFFAELSIEQLSSALALMQERHPLLGTTLVLDERGMPWLTSDGVQPIEPVIVDREGDDHVLKVLEAEMALPFQAPPRPLTRVIWLRPMDARREPSDMIICGPHFLGDAVSHVIFFRDLFHLVDETPGQVTPLDEPTRQSTILPFAVRSMMPKTPVKFKRWFAFLKLFHAISSMRAKKRDPIENFAFKTSRMQFSAALTSELVSRCKREGVTVQAAVCTAFSRRFNTIYTPVNLRDRLAVPVGDAIGLFATGSNVWMRYNGRKSFWDNARVYQKKLVKALRPSSLFFIYTLLNPAVPMSMLRQFWELFSGSADAGRLAITNWGVLEKLGISSTMGRFRIDSFTGAVSARVNSIVIFVHTLGGTMHLQPMYNEHLIPSSEIEQIVRDATRLLGSALK
ncbi:MAG: hypothetical protein GYA24_10595 [Candidatus Lokiarchaeota archaeon]|nr:hypothetical protein [Candidatus Lokiarchaeota archaeon]